MITSNIMQDFSLELVDKSTQSVPSKAKGMSIISLHAGNKFIYYRNKSVANAVELNLHNISKNIVWIL